MLVTENKICQTIFRLKKKMELKGTGKEEKQMRLGLLIVISKKIIFCALICKLRDGRKM